MDSRVYIRENGTPSLAPKGTFMVLDEEHILLPEGVSSHDFLNSPNYVKYYNHEAGHIEQARVLGPLYVPTYLLLWALVGFSYERHPMEKYANERAEILKVIKLNIKTFRKGYYVYDDTLIIIEIR